MAKKKNMTIDDFKLDPPTSIRELVMDSIYSDDVNAVMRGQKVKPLTEEGIDTLMQTVYQRIEAEALKVYGSTEIWALKAWAYSTILKDVLEDVASEATEPMVEQLMAPVKEWSEQHFNPITNFQTKLSGYSHQYIKCCMKVVREFVLKYGKKQRYSEAEILDYIRHLQKTYGENTSSYATNIYRLKTFLDTLPEDNFGRRQTFPLKRLPTYPSHFYQPTLSEKDLESLAVISILDEKPETTLRLLLAEIYGLRLQELCDVESKYINLDHGQPTITFLVRKKRRSEPIPVVQPIPPEDVPFFDIPISRTNPHRIAKDLKRMCQKAGIQLPARGGFHSIRRAVVTSLWGLENTKELSIRRFLRWSTAVLGVLPSYVQKPAEITDVEILKIHPYLGWWKLLASYAPLLPRQGEASTYLL
jgi:integrase